MTQLSEMQSKFAAALMQADAPVPADITSHTGARPKKRFNVYRNNIYASLILVLEGRFPVVLGYCFLGVAIGAFAVVNADFLSTLPTREIIENGVSKNVPNFNAAVPIFVISYLPHGVIGITIDDRNLLLTGTVETRAQLAEFDTRISMLFSDTNTINWLTTTE